MQTGSAPVISIRDLKVHCSTCSMRELCLPVGLNHDDLKQVDSVLGNRVKLRKGDSLYRAGEPFARCYAVRIGSLKTTVLAEDGREQVSGYHMLGDIIGLDGIGTDRHGCQAIALEDTDVCVLPFERHRGNGPRRPAAAAQPAQAPVAGDLARPERHAAARQHARRGAPRRRSCSTSPTATSGAATRRPSTCCG